MQIPKGRTLLVLVSWEEQQPWADGERVGTAAVIAHISAHRVTKLKPW